MINESILHKLNKYAFGADIDNLESYVADFKTARSVADLAVYNENFKIAESLLGTVKPLSEALNDSAWLKKEDKGTKDLLFLHKLPFEKPVAYGIASDVVSKFKDYNFTDSSEENLLAIRKIPGLNVRVVYSFGYLVKAQLYNNNILYNNVAKLIGGKLPQFIKEFQQEEYVELRGVITSEQSIDTIKNLSKNIYCYVARCLRTELDIDNLQVYFDDVIFYDDNKFNCQWDKLEFLNALDINTNDYIMIPNISRNTFKRALLEIHKYFDSLEYKIKSTSFEVRISSQQITRSGNCMIYNGKELANSSVFSSVVKSVNTVYITDRLVQKINIVNTPCNDWLSINSIVLDDVLQLDLFNVEIGKKINFIVVEGEALLV